MPYNTPEKRRAHYAKRLDYFRAMGRNSYWKHREKRLAQVKTYRLTNLEKVRAKSREKYQRIKNDPAYKAYQRNYQKKHRRRLKNYRKAYQQKHRERLAKNAKARYRANKAYIAAYKKAWYTKNKVNRQKYRHRHYTKNKKRYYDNLAKFRAANPGYHSAITRKRMAAKLGVSTENLKAVTAFYKHVHTAHRLMCHWCKKPIPKRERTVDHVIPIARGGKHSPDNLVPAHWRCNCAKGKKMPDEFLRHVQFAPVRKIRKTA